MSAIQLSQDQLQAKFDLGISLILASWEALSLAVQNQWGGDDSADKRDWFAGVISDFFSTNPEIDPIDIEEMLIQIMEDEFDVTLEDGSEIAIAASIIQIQREITDGHVSTVEQLWNTYKAKKPKHNAVRIGPSTDDEESVDDETDDEDNDMGDDQAAPTPSKSHHKPEPDIDEDGFTKVTGRRR